MDFTKMTLSERAGYCLNIYHTGKGKIPKCSDNFNENRECGGICCGHCPEYTGCGREKCRQVWLNPYLITDKPEGRLHYVVLATGRLVSESVPCLISEMYDDNE